jgi:hypothetical protein
VSVVHAPAVARRPAVGRIGPAAIPAALGLAYVALIVVRLPQVIGWQNADSDVASTYVVAAALFHGHAGQVQFSTQGSWLDLGWQFLTHSLPDHRVLWEAWAPALGALTGAALWCAVARVAGRTAGLLAAALLLATSPDGLMNLVSEPWHNTSTLGAVLLGAYAVWLVRAKRGRRELMVAVAVISVLTGVFLACDHLLMIIGVLPFLAAACLAAAVRRDARPALAAVLTTLGAGVLAAAVSVITRALNLRTTTPGLSPASPHMMVVHLRWLEAGLLRLGNGIAVQRHGPFETGLVVIAAAVTVCGLGALAWVTRDSLRARHTEPGRAVHAAYWCTSAICAVLAYVFTNAAYEPSDRYIFIVVVAVAATAPLLSSRGLKAQWRLAGAASIYLAAGMTAFAAGAMHTPAVIITGSSVPEASRITAVVRRDHLSIGYAGYWNASSLEWSSDERLHVYPLLGTAKRAAPMFSMRVASWYAPHPATPTYLVLAPGDPTLPDETPTWLPRPQQIIHLDRVTLEIWPYDIAAYLAPSEIPVPGEAAPSLREACDRDGRAGPGLGWVSLGHGQSQRRSGPRCDPQRARGDSRPDPGAPGGARRAP